MQTQNAQIVSWECALLSLLPVAGRTPLISCSCDQLFVGETATGNPSEHFRKARGIVALAGVEPKHLLIQVAEKVFGIHMDVSPAKGMLQKVKEVFQPICGYTVSDVLDGVIDKLVDVVRAKRLIGIHASV